ncbi:MAG: CoA transferase, partial [bacterium]
MLTPYRVIDLSNERGLLCGQILADLGADVIQVEPLEGSSARRCGPWHKGEPGLENSLFWWAYTRNKRSLALDFEAEEGLAQLKQLIRGADFLIESGRPGDMERLGLGYEALSRENPGLIYVSISAFGQLGPKAHWHDSDLTQMASSGHAYLTGDADGPPLRICVPQGHAHGATDGAVGALIAHLERKHSGRGQHIDISIQQSATLATQFRSLDVPLEQAPAERLAGGVHIVGEFVSTRYELRDGHVVLGPAFLLGQDLTAPDAVIGAGTAYQVITGQEGFDVVVSATNAGAFDFIAKSENDLVGRVGTSTRNAFAAIESDRIIANLSRGAPSGPQALRLVSTAPSMKPIHAG